MHFTNLLCFFSISPKKSFFYWSQSLLPNHWEIKWLNIVHLPRVFASAQGQLTDEHDILSLRQHDEKPLTIPHVPMDAMFIRSAVCKLIPRWTRPVRRVSSWRSAMSSLTSFRRGGSSLAARSRKGRWDQNINVASIQFLNNCLHSVLSKVTSTTIANLHPAKGADGIMFQCDRDDPNSSQNCGNVIVPLFWLFHWCPISISLPFAQLPINCRLRHHELRPF